MLLCCVRHLVQHCFMMMLLKTALSPMNAVFSDNKYSDIYNIF